MTKYLVNAFMIISCTVNCTSTSPLQALFSMFPTFQVILHSPGRLEGHYNTWLKQEKVGNEFGFCSFYVLFLGFQNILMEIDLDVLKY